MKTVTKRDLVVKISNETRMRQQQVASVIQETLDTITGTLAGGDEVVLRNFGSFQVRETKQNVGRNPNRPGATRPSPLSTETATRDQKSPKIGGISLVLTLDQSRCVLEFQAQPGESIHR